MRTSNDTGLEGLSVMTLSPGAQAENLQVEETCQTPLETPTETRLQDPNIGEVYDAIKCGDVVKVK